MATRVQYLTASDGVRIAYAVTGRGPVLVSMPPLPFRHLELEWKLPGDGRWLERLAQRHTLVQYDPRGLGLSDRDATVYSLEALERDIDAVVERVATDGAILFAAVTSGSLAISYAARHPERVSHLVLWCATARTFEGLGSQIEAAFGLIETDWELFTETVAHVVRGWSSGEEARRFAEVLRACASPEAVRALVHVAREVDVTDLLPRVRCPTLVLHRRDLTWLPVERSTRLAASIPDARLVLLDGASMAPWAADMEAAARAIEEFVGTGGGDASEASPAENSFCREGEYWTISFHGRLCRLREAKGLHHIAYLLAHPFEQVAALDLVRALEPGAPATAKMAVDGDAGPALDARAKASYRRRLEDLEDDLQEAERFNDTGRAEAARSEIDFLRREISAAVGLGRRDRKPTAAAERARLTVTKRIRDALERIRQSHPELGQYLERSVRTGLLCAYVPEQPVRWSF